MQKNLYIYLVSLRQCVGQFNRKKQQFRDQDQRQKWSRSLGEQLSDFGMKHVGKKLVLLNTRKHGVSIYKSKTNIQYIMH